MALLVMSAVNIGYPTHLHGVQYATIYDPILWQRDSSEDQRVVGENVQQRRWIRRHKFCDALYTTNSTSTERINHSLHEDHHFYCYGVFRSSSRCFCHCACSIDPSL